MNIGLNNGHCFNNKGTLNNVAYFINSKIMSQRIIIVVMM